MPRILLLLTQLCVVSAINAQNLIPYREGNQWGLVTPEGVVKVSPKYASLGEQHSNMMLFAMEKNEKKLYGYLDANGKEVVPAIYTAAYEFVGDKALVKQANLWGFINDKGKELTNFSFSEAENFQEGLASVSNEEGQWGVINEKGKWVIQPTYDEISSFTNGYAVITKNEKYGFIDNKGTVIVPAKYNEIGNFENGIAQVKDGDKWGYINTKGQLLVPCKYDNVYDFKEDMGMVQLGSKRGFVDKTGKEVIPPKYSAADNCSEGLIGVQNNGKWGFVDKKGETVIPFIYDNKSNGSFTNGLAAVVSNGKWGYIDKQGKIVIPCTFDYAENFVGKYAVVSRKIATNVSNKETSSTNITIQSSNLERSVAQVDLRKGIIDMTGKLLVPMDYHDIKVSNKNTALISKNGKLYGIWDIEAGKEILACNYQRIMPFEENNLAIVQYMYNGNKRMGYFHRNGKSFFKD